MKALPLFIDDCWSCPYRDTVAKDMFGMIFNDTICSRSGESLVFLGKKDFPDTCPLQDVPSDITKQRVKE